MGIALFVIALVSNIFTILIVRFGFIGNYEYKQGMILGVHIPQENIGDEEVAGLIEKTKHNYKIFQNVNVVLGIVICFVNFLNYDNICAYLVCVADWLCCRHRITDYYAT